MNFIDMAKVNFLNTTQPAGGVSLLGLSQMNKVLTLVLHLVLRGSKQLSS